MNDFDIKLDRIIFAIYSDQFQNDGALADFSSELNQKLFKHFVYDSEGSIEEVTQRFYNLASEKFFALGFKAALKMQKELNL